MKRCFQVGEIEVKASLRHERCSRKRPEKEVLMEWQGN